MADYNLGTASGRIVVDGSAAEAGFNVARTAAGAFFDVVKMRAERVRDLGKRLTAVGTAGVAGFGVAINTAANFEKAMSGVFAVANANEEQMEALRQKALQLGADTAFSASEAALALEELTKAGISVEDSLGGAADATVALAAAGGTSLPEAATIAANAMNQFELSAKQVPKVADILAGVANTSAADVSTLGQSLSQAGAIANLAGLSFRDTAIALGQMADAGIQGSDAGTSLKTMLNNLIPSTDAQSSKFKELGLLQYNLVKANKLLNKEGLKQAKTIEGAKEILGKYVDELGMGTEGTVKNAKAVDKLLMSNGALKNQFFDAQGNVKKLAQLEDVLGKSLKGLTREQKLASLEVLFGADAMRASAILSLAGADGYKKFSDEVRKTSAAEVAKTRMDNLSGATEQLKGSLETARIIIGNVFLPIVTKIVKGLTFLVNVFNKLPKPIQVTIAVIAAIASVMSLLIGLFILAIPAIVAFVAQFFLMRGIGAVTAGFRAFYAAQKAGLGVMAAQRAAFAASAVRMQRMGRMAMLMAKVTMTAAKVMRAAWLIATGPIGIAIAIIAAVIGLGVLLYKKWAPFRELVDKIAAILKEKLQQAWTALQPTIQKVVAALQEFGQFVASTLLPVLSAVGKELLGKLLKAWGQLADQVMTQLWPAIQQLVAVFKGELVPAMQDLWSKAQPLLAQLGRLALLIGGVLVVVIGKLGKMFITYVLPILIKIAGFIGGVLIDTLMTLISGVIDVVTGIVKVFTGLINFFKGLFTGNWSQMWEGIKQIFSGIWDLIVGAFKIYMSVGILKIAGLAVKGLWAILKSGWTFILSLFRGAGAGVVSLVRMFFGLIPKLVRGYFAIWKAIVRLAWTVIKAIFRNGAKLIWNVVKGAFRLIVAIVKGQLSVAKGIISGAWNAIKALTSKAWKALKDGVVKTVQALITFVGTIGSKILSALSGFGSLLFQVGKDLIQGMINGVKSMVGAAADAVKDLGKGMLNAGKSVLGIGSPSKIFRQYGVWTVDGNIEGLEDRKKQLAQAARQMGRVLIDNYDSTLKPASVALNGGKQAVAFAAAVPQSHKRPTPKGEKSAAPLRLVAGKLSIDKSGNAYIRGVAEEVVDDNEEFTSRGSRRGPR